MCLEFIIEHNWSNECLALDGVKINKIAKMVNSTVKMHLMSLESSTSAYLFNFVEVAVSRLEKSSTPLMFCASTSSCALNR